MDFDLPGVGNYSDPRSPMRPGKFPIGLLLSAIPLGAADLVPVEKFAAEAQFYPDE
jgi:hypothetical protein